MQSGEVAGGEGLGWLQSGAGGGSVRVREVKGGGLEGEV